MRILQHIITMNSVNQITQLNHVCHQFLVNKRFIYKVMYILYVVK